MLNDRFIAQVARQIDGPFWIYDAQCIRQQIARLKRFDTIRFAQKANSNIHVLKLMREQGVLVDAVSEGELARALAAGYQPGSEPADIVFTADIIERSVLKRVIELDIPVNCGSPDMIAQVGQAKRGHAIWIRINPGFGHGHSAKTNTGGAASKHGVWHEDMARCMALVQQYGLKLVGLHMHIGSGVDYNHLQSVCDAMVKQVKALGQPIEAISAGGGLSTPYRAGDPEIDTDHYFDCWDAARRELEAHFARKLRLEIEPGRFLSAQCGTLVAEVYAVKPVADKHFVLINAGFNDLARPAMYGSYHRIHFINAQGEALSSAPTPVAVAGPLCESGDVFTQTEGGVVEFRSLPLPQPGHLALIRDAGAYGATMSSNYNSRPLIPELLIDGEQVRVIRRKQTMDELLALEQGHQPLPLVN